MTLTPEKLDEIDRLSKRLLSTGWRAWDAQDVGVAVNALPALVAAARERDALRAALADMLMLAEYFNWQDAEDGRSVTYGRARAALDGRHE